MMDNKHNDNNDNNNDNEENDNNYGATIKRKQGCGTRTRTWMRKGAKTMTMNDNNDDNEDEED